MRLVIGIVGAAVLIATPALACDFHEGFCGQYSGYEGASYEDMLAARARVEAEREQAMETARKSFLARFDIQTDEPATPSAVAVDKAELKRISNVDRRAPADAQDR